MLVSAGISRHTVYSMSYLRKDDSDLDSEQRSAFTLENVTIIIK